MKKRKKRRKIPFPLKDILRRHGLTQYALAQITGYSEQYISDLCRGRRKPSWDTLLWILTSIDGADLGDLLPGKGGAA
jgi:transcriptional regulator with XRE-family HTH domain